MRYSDTIVDATVQTLLTCNTLAGAKVESERVDEIAAGDTPRIVVYATDDAQGTSLAGTAPRFQVTQTLVVQCLIERALKPDAQADLRALIQQSLEGLLNDGAWVKLTEFIASFRITRTYKGENERIIGDGRIEFTMRWSETYPPTITTPLKLVSVVSSPWSVESEIALGTDD